MGHRLTCCTFCGVGCGMYLETSAGRVVGVYPSLSHPTNRGRICLRGWHVHEVAGSPDRLLHPLVRRNADFEEVSWEEAVGYAVERMREIARKHGPNALAFLNSPRCSNEEAYLLQKLARAVIGTNNVDHGAGVYVHNSIHVLMDMLGVPATTNPIGDLERSNVILVDGVDLGRQTPTVGGIVLRSKLRGAKLIVVDARRHRIAENADIFLQVRPGTEAMLYGALARVIVDRGWENRPFLRNFCENVRPFYEALQRYDLLDASEECGVPAAAIEEAAECFARASAASLLYSTGLEARHVESIRAAVNLTLLTGQIGRPGAGVYALTEHNNLQGVCDMGVLPDMFPGYRPVGDPEAARTLGDLWDAEVPTRAGVSAGDILCGLGNGTIRGMWLDRYDPASTALFGDAIWALQQCEFIVVQHLFMTETARYADVILPSAAFGEETVSFTSTDRRIQLAEKVTEAPGETEPAWRHLVRAARAFGADWGYESSAEIMEEIGRAVPFYEAADYDNLRRDYGVPWPCTRRHPLGTLRLCQAGDEERPRFRLRPVGVPEHMPRSREYPFTLMFGDSHYYWHRNVLIQHSETLKREHRILLLDYPEGFVEVNTDDARELSIRDGERIRVISADGSVEVAARVTAEVRRGAVFVPYFVGNVDQAMRGARNHTPYVPVRLERIST